MGTHTRSGTIKEVFGIEMGGHIEGGERGFSRKKISKGMRLEARDFSEKNFFRNFKILCGLSCASRRLGLGGGGLPYAPLKTANLPQIRLYKRTKRCKRCKCMIHAIKPLKQPYKPYTMNLGTVLANVRQKVRQKVRMNARIARKAKGKGQKVRQKSMNKGFDQKTCCKGCEGCKEQKRAAPHCCNRTKMNMRMNIYTYTH